MVQAGQVIRAVDFAGVQLTDTTGQTIPDSSVTQLEWNSVVHDPAGMADLANDAIVAPAAGLWLVTCYVRISLGSGFRVQVGLRRNGSTISIDDRTSAGGAVGFVASDLLLLSAGDSVTATFYQEGGSSADVNTGFGSPTFSMSPAG